MGSAYLWGYCQVFTLPRDEAHRFAITYHRKVRHREMYASQLDGIPGIGPARKRTLLKNIGSVKEIGAATEKTLAEIEGIGPELAAQIYKHFHPDIE